MKSYQLVPFGMINFQNVPVCEPFFCVYLMPVVAKKMFVKVKENKV